VSRGGHAEKKLKENAGVSCVTARDVLSSEQIITWRNVFDK